MKHTFMRYGHGKCGMIGLTLEPETLKIWGLSLINVADLKNIQQISAVHRRKKTKRCIERKTRVELNQMLNTRKAYMRRKLELCIDLLDPTKHPQTRVDVATGQLPGQKVNVDKTTELGTAAMKQFESKWPEGFDTKISTVIETQAETKKHLRVWETKVFDTNLIYTTVIGLQTSSRDMEIDRILAHELAPVPTSMSTDNVCRRIVSVYE